MTFVTSNQATCYKDHNFILQVSPRQDKESIEQQQQGGYDRYEEQQLWEKVDEELFVCLTKVDCLIVYLVDGLKYRKTAGLCFECLFAIYF